MMTYDFDMCNLFSGITREEIEGCNCLSKKISLPTLNVEVHDLQKEIHGKEQKSKKSNKEKKKNGEDFRQILQELP
jgi:hypothetical protein